MATFSPPAPFKDITQAKGKEIKERFNYAMSIIEHPHLKISEEELDALSSYKDACEGLIELAKGSGADEVKGAAIARIQEYETSLQSPSSGPANLSFELATKRLLGDELDNLFNVWTLSRYDAYLPDEIKQAAKNHPSAQDPDPWHRAFWAPFHERLDAEAPAFSQLLSGHKTHNKCSASLLLALLCERHTIDWDEAIALIRSCALDGLSLPPKCDFAELLRDRDVAGLATRLDRDEASMSLSTEFVLGVPMIEMAYYRTNLPEALFDRDEFDCTQWRPRKPLTDRLALTEGHEQSLRELFRELYSKQFEYSEDDEEMDEDGEEDEEEFEDLPDDFPDEEGMSDDSDDY